MGARIAAFYAEAESIAGLDGKIQLAMLTRIPSTKAYVEPDSVENVARFESAMQQLRRSINPAFNPSSLPPVKTRFSTIESSGTTRALPGSDELLWGVLGSLDDAMVTVFERSGQSLLAWESKALERRYPVVGPEPLGTLIAREVGTRLSADIARVYDAGTSAHAEIECSFGDGQVWLSITLSAVHNEAGHSVGVNAFIQDISEQKRQKERHAANEARLRAHNRVLLELLTQKSSFVGDKDETLRRVTEESARTLGVSRVSVWLFDATRTKIVCENLFELGTTQHSRGAELSAEQFPAYFEALTLEQTIAAHDAHTDPRTACFSEPYLTPLGITSLLDAPIWVHGEMVGVLCHEHIGAARNWEMDEENFACMLASFVALALELS